MSLIASILIDSVAYGMVLFVISIGLSITLGLMGFVNLAHGVFAMAGGYAAAWLMKSFGIDYSLSVIGAVLLVALVAWPLQRLLYSRLQDRSDLDQVLFSIGLVFVGIAGMGVMFGNAITPLPLPEFLRGSVDVGFRVVPTQRIAAVVVGIAVLAGLVWLLERTRFGIETRAAVEDASAARALGIRTSRVYILGFSLGAGLAALGGVIGADVAAKAVPNGYTLLIGQASNLAINQHLMSKLPYDPVKDFAPITLIATSPGLLVVHPSLPIRTVKDLVALAKSRPGTINYASAGNGSPGHLAAAYFNKVAHIDLLHVPYKGATPAMMDVIAGHASLYFTSPVAAQTYVQSGRLRQIAVTSAQRFPPLPDVPSIAEAGYPDFDMTSWWGLLAPAGIPRDIVARLHTESVTALNAAEMKERLAAQGALVVTNAPDQFASYLKSEIANWGRIVKASGARLD